MIDVRYPGVTKSDPGLWLMRVPESEYELGCYHRGSMRLTPPAA